MHASILIPLKGKINMLKEFFIFITFDKVTTDSQKGMRQYTLISSLPTNHFISSKWINFHLIQPNNVEHFPDEWLDWKNPKCEHFELGGFCLEGYQSPNILEHFLEYVMSSLYLDIELQSTIFKILFSTVFAFLVMLLGQQIGHHSFGSFLGKELMHSGRPIQTIWSRVGCWYDRDSQLDSWSEQEKWDINTDIQIFFVHCLWYSVQPGK